MGYFSPIKLYDMDSSPSSGSKSPSSDSKSHKGPSTVYKSPVKHRMTRRASFHDYTMPGIYMFTLQKHPEAPVLSHVLGNPGVRHGENAPRVVLSAIGCIFDEELQKTASMRSNDLVIRKYVIMPDHIHILLELKRMLSRPVTNLVAIIESVTTRRCRDAGLIPQEAGTSTKSEDMSYDKASRLNRLAERLAALTPDATVALKGEGPG